MSGLSKGGLKLVKAVAVSALVVFLLPFLANPGCGVQDHPDPSAPGVCVEMVRCPFTVGSGTSVLETDSGPVVLGEKVYSLEPNGVPCTGHVLEVRR